MQARVNRVGARKSVLRSLPNARMGGVSGEGGHQYGIWSGTCLVGSGNTKGGAWRAARKALRKGKVSAHA